MARLVVVVAVTAYYAGAGWLLGGTIGFGIGCALAALALWILSPALLNRL